MNRKLRRQIEKKFGSDFPLDKFLACYEMYRKEMEIYDIVLDVDDFIIHIIRQFSIDCYFDNEEKLRELGLALDEPVIPIERGCGY